MSSVLRPALVLLGIFAVLTGVAYPVVVTVLTHALFPRQANGSVIMQGDLAAGSELIGQPFDEPKYFWSRPSATGARPYDGRASTGSNLCPSNPSLFEAVKGRVEALRAADPGNIALTPIDLVTTSGSGLDPHISPAAALYQVARVARVRGVSEAEVNALVEAQIEGPTLGVLGAPRVNVLKLNLALDAARQ